MPSVHDVIAAERRRAFRRELAEALELGVSRKDVADVVRAFAGDPEVDEMELRRELQKLVPVQRFHEGDTDVADEATGGPSSPSPVTPRPQGARVAGLPSFSDEAAA